DDDGTRDSGRAGRPRHRGRPGRRPRRRPRRRRRGLGDRRRAPPAGAVPGPEVRDPGGAGRPRGHLVDQPVPRHPLRQRPVHLRLPVQAVARTVDRVRPGDPGLPRRGDRRGRARAAHPLPPPGHRGRLVRRRAPVDRARHPHRHRGAAALHHRLPVDVPGLLRPREAPPAALARDGPVPRHGRAPAAVARRPRPRREAGGRHRVGLHRLDAGPGARGVRGARDDGAALAVLLLRPADHPRAGRGAGAARPPAGVDPRDPAPPVPDAVPLAVDDGADRTRRAARVPHRGDPAAAARGHRRREALHPAVPPVAAAHRHRPRRRLLRGAARGAGLGRHRHRRGVHRDRDPDRLRRGAGGRRRRHRDGLRPGGVRRHPLHRRRRAGRLRRAHHLAREDYQIGRA
ncbi:MAG: Monooxygenase, flavin-binding family, partial [uncultured Pseudonocardia sp.]